MVQRSGRHRSRHRDARAAAAETSAATVPTDTVSLGAGGAGGDLVAATTGRMMASVMMQANVKLLQSAQEMDDALLQLLVR